MATVEGKDVTVHVSSGPADKSSPSFPFNATKINDANMVFLDVMACNGVVHVIDQVLLPAWGDALVCYSPIMIRLSFIIRLH